MANWKQVRYGVGRATGKAIQKTGEIADMASLYLKLKNLNLQLNERYETLGKLTYKQLKTETSQAEKIAEVIKDIDQLREQVCVQKDRILALKAERAAAKEAAKEAAKQAEAADQEAQEEFAN